MASSDMAFHKKALRFEGLLCVFIEAWLCNSAQQRLGFGDNIVHSKPKLL